MAGDGADALQVPPAIPAVGQEDPEGVSGERPSRGVILGALER